MKKYITPIFIIILSVFVGMMSVVTTTYIFKLYPFELNYDIIILLQDIIFVFFHALVVRFIVKKRIFNYKKIIGIIQIICFIIMSAIVYIGTMLLCTAGMYGIMMQFF